MTDSPRFIPAHAGNSASSPSASLQWSVHPRACGEQLYNVPTPLVGDGSSPRMRGTGSSLALCLSLCRFIPAHAGNRGKELRFYVEWPVHPPRMRGTVYTAHAAILYTRFIPAHAGNRIEFEAEPGKY